MGNDQSQNKSQKRGQNSASILKKLTRSSNKPFAGEGKVLGNGQTKAAPEEQKRSSNKTSSNVPSSGARHVVNRVRSGRSHVQGSLTESQRREQRQNRIKAAEERDQKWANRLGKHRAKKRAAGLLSSSSGMNESTPSEATLHTGSPVPGKASSMDTQHGGFSVFKSNITNSATMSAIGSLADSSQQDGAVEQSPVKDTEQSAISEDKIATGSSLLSQAIDDCTLPSLRLSIQRLSELKLTEGERAYLQPDIEQVNQLIHFLSTDCEQDQNAAPASSAVIEQLPHEIDAKLQQFQAIQGFVDSICNDSEAIDVKVDTLNVVFKLLTNLITNPENKKYRTINLENKIIKTKLVDSFNGAALQIFSQTGFQPSPGTLASTQLSTANEPSKNELVFRPDLAKLTNETIQDLTFLVDYLKQRTEALSA